MITKILYLCVVIENNIHFRKLKEKIINEEKQKKKVVVLEMLVIKQRKKKRNEQHVKKH